MSASAVTIVRSVVDLPERGPPTTARCPAAPDRSGTKLEGTSYTAVPAGATNTGPRDLERK
ncbi:hypothetical protein PSA01_27400 [Pseudonocardia saturnea]|uniref:Uncharacterized protein n=1 Tax=Pseudonocardia saturnea TaxID=33909 RepID=A0ABQ0RYJ3_9PSEU|nr:hypothetical protein Pdca_57960 [Pseudonocardia autotrophica]GEC25711.1 hypothetical protein PSA01_27400 [Pseudonocardia saturnea]